MLLFGVVDVVLQLLSNEIPVFLIKAKWDEFDFLILQEIPI